MKYRQTVKGKPASGTSILSEQTVYPEAKHKRIEKKCQDSEDQYRDLYDEAPIAYYSVSVNGCIQMANRQAVELLGYSVDELVDRPVFELYADTPDGKARAHQIFQRFKAGGNVENEELEMIKADGSEIWVALSIRPIRDEAGRVIASRSIITDITKRRQVEADLRRSEQDLAIRSHIADIFLTLPDEQMYGEVLQVILERMESKYGVFGYIADDGTLVYPSTAINIRDQWQVSDHDALFQGETWQEIWNKTLTEKKPFFSNQPLPIPQGDSTVQSALVVPIIYAGNGIGIIVVANKPVDYNEKDIHVLETIASYLSPILNVRLQRDKEEKALQQAEDLFRTVCDSSPIGIYITQDGLFQYVNPEMKGVMGYSDSEILGTDSISYVLPADRDVVRANAIARLKGKQILPYEYRIVTKAGDIKYIMESINPIRYQDKQAILGNFMDITELKQTRQKMDEYKALNKFKTDLLSTVSHELRTPLSIIKGYSTLLLDYDQDLSPEEKQEYLRSTDSATDRLSELVDRLLDMSRLEAGLLTLTKEPTSILQLIKKAVSEGQLRAPKHKISSSTGQRLPRPIVDSRRIRQVLDNLIDNACKYSPEGTEITVSARRTGKKLVISVSDQGIGIPAGELPRVFDRMYRIEQRLSSLTQGMGLGLAICKGLVEAHKGQIWMESGEGKGTTCFFTLPLHTKASHLKSEKGTRQSQFPL